LFNQRFQQFVIRFCPKFFGLVGESSVSAVAHFGVSSREKRNNLFEKDFRVGTESQKCFILFFGPGSLGFIIPLL
jgi:hypothetical protein